LGSDDDRLAAIGYDAFKLDVIVENLVLEVEAVEVFGWRSAVSKRTQGYAIPFVTARQGRFQVALGLFLKINLMFATLSEDRRQTPSFA
jgi:hypothetical protein